jgi:hypothetical protein
MVGGGGLGLAFVIVFIPHVYEIRIIRLLGVTIVYPRVIIKTTTNHSKRKKKQT